MLLEVKINVEVAVLQGTFTPRMLHDLAATSMCPAAAPPTAAAASAASGVCPSTRGAPNRVAKRAGRVVAVRAAVAMVAVMEEQLEAQRAVYKGGYGQMVAEA